MSLFLGFENTISKLITLKNQKDSVEAVVNKSTVTGKSENYTVALKHILSSIEKLDVNLDVSKITTLELSHCNLRELPPDFKLLKLKHLGLAHNNFQHVPLCLYSSLKDLESLNLSHNLISDFDMAPDCVLSLKTLQLNHNSFENLPKWLLSFKSTNLEELNYSCNKASHYIYKKNSYNLNVTKIRKLKLRNAHMIDSDFSFLRCFKLLEYLDLSNKYNKCVNKFKDIDELFVKQAWKQLHVLKLDNLSISFFPEGILWLESLKELNIQQNIISWLPEGIRYMVNLELLDISNNLLVGIPEEILELHTLKVLKAAHNKIDEVPDFSSMKSLSTIDLYDNRLETFSCNLQTVKYIDLECNYIDTGKLGSDYSKKMVSYRQIQDYHRANGIETSREFLLEKSSTSEESEPGDLVTILSEDIVFEDWDAPSTVRQTCPDIDSSDEDWQGDEVYILKPCIQFAKVYVPDEDWMFEDAD
nr:unnamed protein product [Callosobruchus analis]